MRNVLMYSSGLAQHEYKPSHPFKPMRAKLMYELFNRYGLLSGDNQIIVEPKLMDTE